MKKMYLVKSMAALAMGLVAVSCNKASFDEGAYQNAKEQESQEQFVNNVMGGQQIDPNQNWKTTTAVKLTVNSEIAEGVLKVYAATPVGQNVPALYVGTISKGEQKTITVTCPSDVQRLYTAVYDSENYMRYEVSDVNSTNLSVKFASSNAVSAPARRAPGTYYTNTHSFLPTPDESIFANSVPGGVAYFGDLRDPWGKYDIYHYTETTFWIDAASVEATKSLKLQPKYGQVPTTSYIVGTVYAPADLYLTAGSKLYLTKGSKFVLPTGGFSFGQSDVQIIIAEGAELVCDAKLQFSNTILYNNGKVTTPYLEFAGSGKVYNAAKGTLDITTKLTIANNNCEVVNDGILKAGELQVNGSGHFMNNNQTTIYRDAVVNSNNNSWINNGTFHCDNFLYNGGGSYNVINNCKLICDHEFLIGIGQNQGEFKLDGSIECNTFTHGIGNTKMTGKSVIKVAETLTCQAMADGCYFGFYGPDSDANGYAVIQAKKITAKTLTQRRSISYRGYLIVATDDHWDQCDANDGNYPYWDQGDNVKMSLKNKSDISQKVDATDCNAGIEGKIIIHEEPIMYYYYAFEDLGAIGDFDFNDVVLRLSAPDHGKSKVYVMAAGGTLPVQVTYGGKNLGGEVHGEFDVETGVMVNTGKGPDKEPKYLGTVDVADDDDMADLPFGIVVSGAGSIKVTNEVDHTGEAPLMIVVSGYPSGDDAGKWFWAREYMNISKAYTKFGAWGADVQSNTDWYHHYTEGNVWKY